MKTTVTHSLLLMLTAFVVSSAPHGAPACRAEVSRMDPISIGRIVGPVVDLPPTRIRSTDVRLRPYVSRALFLKLIKDDYGLNLISQKDQPDSDALISPDALARHTFALGPTGTGKSRLLELLAARQLWAGCSLVCIDPKPQMIAHLVAHAHHLSIPAERVTIIDPTRKDYIPGFNPLLAGDLTQAVGDLVSLIETSSATWGPRLADVLTNALFLAGSHRLSILEVVRMLTQHEDYLPALLATPPKAPETYALAETVRFFTHEFPAWTRSERVGAIATVTRRLRECLRNDFLRPFLMAEKNTTDLARLWQEQGLVLCHADATRLGDAGAKLVAGLLTSTLFRTAMRSAGPVPVVLMLDELSLGERMIGRAIADILAVARSQNLRLCSACQGLDQLSSDLRASLLTNPAVKAYFRLGPADARQVAASLAAGFEPQATRLTVECEKTRSGEAVPVVPVRHRLRTPAGDPLRMSEASWKIVTQRPDGPQRLDRLVQMCAAAGVRLFVRAPGAGRVVDLRSYLAGIPPEAVSLSGPAPLMLTLWVPRPKVSGVQTVAESEAQRRYTKTLQELPVRHIVLTLFGREVGIVRVADVPDPTPSPELDAYVAAARRANGQSIEEFRAINNRRELAIRDCSGGGGYEQPEEVEDGSIW